jgi:energy-coupling factor transporter transmembrane protein EcfT
MTPGMAQSAAAGGAGKRLGGAGPASWAARLRDSLRGGDACVCVFAFSLVVGVLCRGWALAAALALSLLLAALVYPAGLRVLLRPRTWILLAMIVVSSTLVGPDPEWTLGPLGISSEGFVLGLNMIMRAIIVIVAVTGLVSTVPVDRIGAVLERVGLHGLGFAVGVAFNLLPLVQRSLVTSWQSMRLRAGLRRPLSAARILLIAAVSSCLRCADEVVLAAEARAFAPGVTSRPAFVWRAQMAPLAALLMVAAGLLVWFPL